MSQSCKLTGRAATVHELVWTKVIPDTTNSRADLDLLGEVIRAWSGLRPRCDPIRKRERCVVLMEGISGERHLLANVARFGPQCALRKRGASRVDRRAPWGRTRAAGVCRRTFGWQPSRG